MKPVIVGLMIMCIASSLYAADEMPPYVEETPGMPEEVPDRWMTYHLFHPGPGTGTPADPNPAYYYKGRYHLHYIYRNLHSYAFAHVSSEDMVYWKWHPTVLVPPFTGHGMYSGTGFFTKEGQPAMIYHGQGSGNNHISFALDDNLDKWTKPVPVLPKDENGELVRVKMWDPDCWLVGDTYYAISGGGPPLLMKSRNLEDWEYLGQLFHDDTPDDLGVDKDEDVSCPNMFRLGDKWMLLCISHDLGCAYYLGDFKDEKFLPEFYAVMNWRDRNVFAPESLLTADGRRVMWACVRFNEAEPNGTRAGIQTLPRELSLPEDGVLRIKPLRELEKLRYEDEEGERHYLVKSGSVRRTRSGFGGDAIELSVTIEPTDAREYGVSLFCDKYGNGFPITIKPEHKVMSMGHIEPPFELKEGEPLHMRIFMDKDLVEVFLNDRQAALYMHEHDKENTGVRLFTRGGDIRVKMRGWKLKSIYSNE